MFDWIEICLFVLTAVLLSCALVPQLRPYRPMLLGAGVLVLITPAYPRRGNSPAANDMVVIPNSVIAKAIVMNHRRLNEPHLCTVTVSIDRTVPPARVD